MPRAWSCRALHSIPWVVLKLCTAVGETKTFAGGQLKSSCTRWSRLSGVPFLLLPNKASAPRERRLWGLGNRSTFKKRHSSTGCSLKRVGCGCSPKPDSYDLTLARPGGKDPGDERVGPVGVMP